MNARRGQHHGDDEHLDDLIQSMFDRDLPLDSRDRLFETLQTDPNAAKEAARTQRVLSLLAGPVPGPDLSSPILDRLERSGVIVSRRGRRVVMMWRVAAVVALTGAAVTIAMIQRAAPDAVGIRSPGAPLAGVADAGEQVGASAADALRSVVARVAHEGHPSAASGGRDRAERGALAGAAPADRLVRVIGEERPLSLPSGAGSAVAATIPVKGTLVEGTMLWSSGSPGGTQPLVLISNTPGGTPSLALPVDVSVQPQLMPVLGQVGGVWLTGSDAWPRGILRPSGAVPPRSSR